METKKDAQQLIDENDEFEADLERQGLATIEKLKKEAKK